MQVSMRTCASYAPCAHSLLCRVCVTDGMLTAHGHSGVWAQGSPVDSVDSQAAWELEEEAKELLQQAGIKKTDAKISNMSGRLVLHPQCCIAYFLSLKRHA